jgi:hypothetical protein
VHVKKGLYHDVHVKKGLYRDVQVKKGLYHDVHVNKGLHHDVHDLALYLLFKIINVDWILNLIGRTTLCSLNCIYFIL